MLQEALAAIAGPNPAPFKIRVLLDADVYKLHLDVHPSK